jgi:hypothetical protein
MSLATIPLLIWNRCGFNLEDYHADSQRADVSSNCKLEGCVAESVYSKFLECKDKLKFFLQFKISFYIFDLLRVLI